MIDDMAFLSPPAPEAIEDALKVLVERKGDDLCRTAALVSSLLELKHSSYTAELFPASIAISMLQSCPEFGMAFVQDLLCYGSAIGADEWRRTGTQLGQSLGVFEGFNEIML